MELQTQYGIDADWRAVPASNVPVIEKMWIATVAASTGMSETEVRAALARGEVIEIKIEWHDRIRKAVA
jgi:hypothetical protein